MPDLLTLSRLQFAMTTVYHFLFVPLTLGLSIYLALFETLGLSKKFGDWRKISLLFGQLFVINFAMGVVTGIVQEFQFGMNWSGYARFVGDIFGAPLAIEALAAFFLESTFLGIWIFGRDKLPRGIHLMSIWIVAIASNLSAFWILAANSFMQAPVGFVLRNGRAEMTDFFALITNPHVLLQFPHVIFSGLSTAAVVIMGVSAWRILLKKDADIFARSLKFGTVAALLSLLAVCGIGDAQGKYLVKHQPMKMAAAEAIWDAQEPAALSLFSVIDEKNRHNNFEIAIPTMLSFMSYNNFTGRVEGINDLQKKFAAEFGPGDYAPPVAITYWSFRIMVGAGSALILATLIILLFFKNNRFMKHDLLLKAIVCLIPLPYLANSTGWILAEVGRQPWIVYKVLLVGNAVSKAVSAPEVLASLIGFTLIYGALAVVDLGLLVSAAGKDLTEVSK